MAKTYLVRYGVWRYVRQPGRRRRSEGRNGKLRTTVHPDAPHFHQHVCMLIRRRHPGWTINGYVRPETEEGGLAKRCRPSPGTVKSTPTG
jgi:hypothetical protein